LILNDFANNPGFTVNRQIDRNTFQVTLGENSPRNPIVIASPVWYTEKKTAYPLDIAHLAIAVERSNIDEPSMFRVQVGTSTSLALGGRLSGHPNVGMNFIALDPALDNDNIVSGFVDVDTTGTVINNLATNKYTAVGIFDEVVHPDSSWFYGENLDRSGPAGVVHVRFTDGFEFEGLPSIIVTPVIDPGSGKCGNGFHFTDFIDTAVPHCVVDTIEKASFAVKCGCVETTVEFESRAERVIYTPLPFNFIAVGPVV